MSKTASTILIVRPEGCELRVLTPQEKTLKTYQEIVGGLIEFVRVSPFELCCNEEGMLLNLPFQRCPLWPDGICGNYFISRGGGASLRPKDLEVLRGLGYRW